MGDPTVLYTRTLPGGGVVTIESLTGDSTPVRAILRVERRGDPRRRSGHEPPVVLEQSGDAEDKVFRSLYEVATDNAAIARCLIAWQARGSRNRRTLDD
jgi:hypothetical protein